jgi:hypothetical protein
MLQVYAAGIGGPAFDFLSGKDWLLGTDILCVAFPQCLVCQSVIRSEYSYTPVSTRQQVASL